MHSTDRRRAALIAALGFVQLAERSAELVTLRRWLDSWAGLGDVIAGLTRQGMDVECATRAAQPGSIRPRLEAKRGPGSRLTVGDPRQ
jgi:hypothetical protein